MVSIDHFRQELRAQMSRAASHGATYILINGGELRRKLRGDDASMEALQQGHASRIETRRWRRTRDAETGAADTVIIDAGPGVGMTIRYLLPGG